MVEATRILQQAPTPAQAQTMTRAVMALARQRAIKAVKQQIRDRGLKPLTAINSNTRQDILRDGECDDKVQVSSCRTTPEWLALERRQARDNSVEALRPFN